MVRSENNVQAVMYARKYLAPWTATYMKEFQKVFVTLAFTSNTGCEIYKVNILISYMFCHISITISGFVER